MGKKVQRITSIDALRAVTLLGILIVHTSAIFCFNNSTNTFEESQIGTMLNHITSQFLQFRCNKIFGILFGISFYLILKNPSYSPYKFIWRCILLIGIGLLNKILYTVDALMWYGIWGIVLVLFRNLSCRWLLISFIITFILSSISIDWGLFKISQENTPLARYNLPTSLNAIMSYPILLAAKDYFVIVSKDPFSCLWQFLMGYYIGKKGIIENLQKYTSITNITLCGIIYLIFFLLHRSHLCVGFAGLVQNCTWILGAFFYSLMFLHLYYRFYPKLRFLEAYGKLGLTNYSVQGFGGVILTLLIFIPNHWNIEYIYLMAIIFFVVQLFLSNIWLTYFTNGPLEWIWRCLTNMKYTNPRLKRKNSYV